MNDKAAGLGNEAMGKLKQGIGSVTDNDKLRAEGVGQEIKGKGQHALGDAKAAVKAAADKAADAVSRKL
jgi:hypothetical protein